MDKALKIKKLLKHLRSKAPGVPPKNEEEDLEWLFEEEDAEEREKRRRKLENLTHY